MLVMVMTVVKSWDHQNGLCTYMYTIMNLQSSDTAMCYLECQKLMSRVVELTILHSFKVDFALENSTLYHVAEKVCSSLSSSS